MDGLGRSNRPETVAILSEYLGLAEWEDVAGRALALKRDTAGMTALIEAFKDADSRRREALARVFESMGPEAESSLMALLREDIESLRPYLAEVMERTGYVESLSRRLNDRRPEVRRDASEKLAVIGTPAGCGP